MFFTELAERIRRSRLVVKAVISLIPLGGAISMHRVARPKISRFDHYAVAISRVWVRDDIALMLGALNCLAIGSDLLGVCNKW